MSQATGPQQTAGAAAGVERTLARAMNAPAAGPVPPARPEVRREQVSLLHTRWQLQPQPFSSALPVVGRLIAAFRTLWNNVATRWYLAPILQQQTDFNATVARFAGQTHDDLRAVEAAVAWMDRATTDARRDAALFRVQLAQERQRVAELEQQARALHDALMRRLDLLTSDMSARLDRLERRTLDRAAVGPPAVPESPPRADLPAVDYVRFEQRFRGPSEQVRAAQRDYLPYFAGAAEVLDIGCGRGEFMEMLREAGVTAVGVDLDADMVAACRAKGLEVVHGDALAWLRARPAGSLGGAFSAQVIEHLTPAQLVELVALLGRTLRPGAPVVFETINPMSLVAASSHFLLDLSHTRLVHPEALRFLLECAGFGDIQVLLRSPAPPDIQLEKLPWPGDAGLLDEWAQTMNRNVDRLNGFLYGHQDYAVVARRLGGG